MFPVDVLELVQITDGILVNGPEEINIDSISIDTRTLKQGDLYIPIRGENYDGHKFISDALLRGACGFLSDRWDDKFKDALRESIQNSTVVVIVKDTLSALHALARHIRKKLDAEVVGITGSTGKTCTKDMISNILSRQYNVVSTEKNYNNEIGVPLTVLKADQETQVLVIEMAMRGLGQIRELAEMVNPRIGLITNVGKTHFELLGSEEKIAEAKSELIEVIPPEGLVVLNADDKWTGKLRDMSPAPVTTYGISKDANVRAVDIVVDEEGQPSFKIDTPGGGLSLSLPYPGRHNIYNALAAYAVASEMGVSQLDIKKGLATSVLSEMRMQVFTTSDGITVLNDAYNANPTSMKAALIALGDMAKERRKAAVLGDMLELGTLEAMAHFKIGELVPDIGADLLITVGTRSRRIAEGALSKGMNQNAIMQCQETDEATKALIENIRPGDIVLIKASRAMELEKVVNALL